MDSDPIYDLTRSEIKAQGSVATVMPPPPMKCQLENCEFETAANLATFDNQFKMLELHLRMAHPQLAPAPGAVSSQAAGGPKPDKLPRPTISEGITQTDRVRFEYRWAR